MAGHRWEDWFEREEFIGQISDIRVQNLQVEREVVQKRTFTRWMNLHLEKCDPPLQIQDLFQDIQDGYVLMALLEDLPIGFSDSTTSPRCCPSWRRET
uniref:Calponin-homology (CH) domain-containing protein n=1 Tax=Poecilia reticulata TaxID=8081 RepID=A0A3P9P858_POERE